MTELKDQKYVLLIKNQGKGYGTPEQVPNGTLTSLTEYEDYLITDVSAGNIPVPEDLITQSDASFCGNKFTTEGRYIVKPEQTIYTNLRGLEFLVKTFLKGVTPLGANRNAYYATLGRDLDFMDLYVGTYDNRGLRASSFQINEFGMEFNQEGQITPTVSGYAHKDYLEPLKDESNLQFFSEPIRFSDLKDIEFRPHDVNGQSFTNGWVSLACAIKTAKLSYNGNIDEDKAFKFCQPHFSSGYESSKFKDVSTENTVDQSDAKWRERFYGGDGFAAWQRINYYDVRYTLVTTDGRELQIILVRANLGLNTGDQSADAEETLTFTPERSLFQLDTIGVKKVNTDVIMIFDNTTSVSEGTVTYTNSSEEDVLLGVKRVVAEGNDYYALLKTVKPGDSYSALIEYGDYEVFEEGTSVDTFSLSVPSYTITTDVEDD